MWSVWYIATRIPCLPSPSCLRQLCPTLGEDASDKTKQAKRARRSPATQDSCHKDQKEERHKKEKQGNHKALISKKTKEDHVRTSCGGWWHEQYRPFVILTYLLHVVDILIVHCYPVCHLLPTFVLRSFPHTPPAVAPPFPPSLGRVSFHSSCCPPPLPEFHSFRPLNNCRDVYSPFMRSYKPGVSAIKLSHTACKDELPRAPQSHSWWVVHFLYTYPRAPELSSPALPLLRLRPSHFYSGGRDSSGVQRAPQVVVQQRALAEIFVAYGLLSASLAAFRRIFLLRWQQRTHHVRTFHTLDRSDRPSTDRSSRS